MGCENCSDSSNRRCCWEIAVEIRAFKKKVLRTYILETIFDAVISLLSVILDIISLILYTQKGKYELAVFTALPILLPTLVFTHVYMSDDSRGYCKYPKQLPSRKSTVGEHFTYLTKLEDKIAHGQGLGLSNIAACCSGCLHYGCHKDRRIRERGGKLVKKTLNRSAKYLFGTLVLRIIAWTWYIKSIVFGIRALREPKKFMNIVPPDEHWSRELLTRLDFLQAALENAPQCVIQLFTLVTDASENKTIGILTLTFSFIDFIRVATSVFWNVEKGPVAAKGSVYESGWWNIANTCSWVLLYTARCSAIGLILGTVVSSQGKFAAILVAAIVFHCALFGKVFSMRQVGETANKIAVTTFISIFFLPELQSTNVQVLVQFYWAVILLENTFFTIPWKGLKFSGYCFGTPHSETKPLSEESFVSLGVFGFKNESDNSERFQGPTSEGCLIDPVIIVLFVPMFTIIGVVLRLAVARRVGESEFSQSPPMDQVSSTMETRVANIYNAKWKTMSTREMWRRFIYMLRKETAYKTSEVSGSPETEEDLFEIELGRKPSIFETSFLASQQSIQHTIAALCIPRTESITEAIIEVHRTEAIISPSEYPSDALEIYDNVNLHSNLTTHKIPPSFLKPASYNSVRGSGNEILKSLSAWNLSSDPEPPPDTIDSTYL